MYLFNDVVKLIYRYMLPKDGNYIITIFIQLSITLDYYDNDHCHILIIIKI